MGIVDDPVGNNIYFGSNYGYIEVINTDGSGRTTLISHSGLQTGGLAVDVKKR